MFARQRGRHSRDELRRFVLDEEQAIGRAAQRVAARHDEAVGCEPRQRRLDVSVRERGHRLFARRAQPVDAQRQERRLVVELHPALGGLEAVSIQPARDQPVRMRVGDAEIGECGVSVPGVRRTRGQRKLVLLPERRAQHRVHESARAWLSRRAGQIHRIVHDRGCRHPIQVEQLIQAETQDGDDLRIELADAALREVLDEMVEAALPPQRAGDDLGSQRPIALVLEMLAAGVECRGQIGPAGCDCAKRVIRSGSRRGGHGA